jgi:superkiller protein 3
MSNLRHRPSTYLFVLVVVLLISIGDLQSITAQPVPGGAGVSRTTSAGDPSVNAKYLAHAGKRSGKLSPTEERQQAIELAIKNGNDARKAFEYEKALSSYRRAQELEPNDARAYYGLGNVYFDLYCYDSAIDFYSQAGKHKTDYFDAVIQLGYSYLNKERYDEAGMQFEAALRLKAANTDAKLGKLYVQAKKGRYQEAIEGINQVINDKSTRDKDRTSAYMALGQTYVAQNNWKAAVEPFEKAARLSPDLAAAYVWLGSAQVTSAITPQTFSQRDLTPKGREDLSAAARLAAETIRTAIDVKHYDHPNGYLMLAMALIYQSNYSDAQRKIKEYLTNVKNLEASLAHAEPRFGKKCDYAFNRLYADGFWQSGLAFVREANEPGVDRNDLLNKAIEQLKKAEEAKPDYAAAYDELGIIYLGQQKYKEAIDEYEKSLRYQTIDSAKGSLYGSIGAAYSQIGPDTEAIFYLNKAIELDPNNPSHYSTLAIVYDRQGNSAEAIRLAKKSMELDQEPTASSYYRFAGVYFSKARRSGSDTDYEESIKLLNEAIRINPRFSLAYFLLGKAYQFYKDGAHADEALANYERAKQYDPNNPIFYLSIGDLYLAKHNGDAALYNLREAIKLKPDYALAYVVLGVIYQSEKHDNAEAIKAYLDAVKYDPKYIDAYFSLASIYRSQKDYAEEVKYLRRVSEIAPNNPQLATFYLELGMLYRAERNYAEAIAQLNAAIAAAPNDFHPYKELAKVFEAQGRNQPAIEQYENAIKYYGNTPGPFARDIYTCRIERLRGHYEAAIACFQKIKIPSSEDPGTTIYDVGTTFVVAKNKKAALVQFEQLKQMKSALADDLLRQINEMK